jgi:L-malate glycosyltransferase
LSVARRLRLAVLVNLVPRKLGSLEGWLVGLAREARARGHALDVLSYGPAHPDFLAALVAAGAGWQPLEPTLRRPLTGVRRLRHYDVLELNLFGARSGAALLAYAAWPARVLFVERTSAPSLTRPSPAGRAKLWLLNRLTVPRIAGLAGVSNYARDRTTRQLGLDPRRALTIYNGVDLERFRWSPRAPAPDTPPTILVVAHLIPQKGVDVLLRGFGRLEDARARLVIVGDGPEQGALRALAGELGIMDRIEFAGLRDDVQDCLERADIFVHPAIWAEAFGWTIAEAMASGCPVVASRTGGIPELIEDGESGLLVEPGNPDALAAALNRLLASSELRHRLAAAARRRAEERFSLGPCAARHVSWCEGVAERPARA